jgi:hypothetical protein
VCIVCSNILASTFVIHFFRTRSQGKGGGYDVFSVEPGEIGLTTLERAGDGID